MDKKRRWIWIIAGILVLLLITFFLGIWTTAKTVKKRSEEGLGKTVILTQDEIDLIIDGLEADLTAE